MQKPPEYAPDRARLGASSAWALRGAFEGVRRVRAPSFDRIVSSARKGIHVR